MPRFPAVSIRSELLPNFIHKTERKTSDTEVTKLPQELIPLNPSPPKGGGLILPRLLAAFHFGQI